MESELPGRRRETPRESRLREHAAGARPPGRRPGAGTVAARASRAGPCASRRARCRGRNRSRLHRPASAGPRAFLPLGFVRGGCYVGAFFFFFFFPLSFNSPGTNWGACVPQTPRCCPLRRKQGLQPDGKIQGHRRATRAAGRRGKALGSRSTRSGSIYSYVLLASLSEDGKRPPPAPTPSKQSLGHF